MPARTAAWPMGAKSVAARMRRMRRREVSRWGAVGSGMAEPAALLRCGERPDIEDAGGLAAVGVAFGQDDPAVRDDRTVPMARTAGEGGHHGSRSGVVDRQAA